MKKLFLLLFIIISANSTFSQVSGLLGSKNIVRFQFIQSPAYAARQPVRMLSDTESKMYLAPFGFVMDIGYERILTRKISLGVDYTFGTGRMAMAGASQKGSFIVPLEDPMYHNHGLMITASFYYKDFAPLGGYVRTGLGFSGNFVNSTINVGTIDSHESGSPTNNQFSSRGKYNVTKTGERQIKSGRGMMNVLIAWGKNWTLSKRLILNLEIGTKWNFAIDGINASGLSAGSLFSVIGDGAGGDFTSLNYRDVERNLFTTKARQELIMINLGLKIAI